MNRNGGRTLAGRKRDPGFEWGALRALAPYLWPDDAPGIRLRVVVALTLLADWLAFGNRPGFGRMQLAGAIIGAAYVLAGLYLARDVERS